MTFVNYLKWIINLKVRKNGGLKIYLSIVCGTTMNLKDNISSPTENLMETNNGNQEINKKYYPLFDKGFVMTEQNTE